MNEPPGGRRVRGGKSARLGDGQVAPGDGRDLSQGRAAVARRAHIPEVAGSNPAPATQLEAVECADRKHPVDPLPRLQKWKKWLRSLKRVKTPNPWTMH